MPLRLSVELKIIMLTCCVLSIIELINFLSGRALNQYGLLPRNEAQWWGIFTQPFLHGNTLHFLSNIVPFAVFSWLVLQHGLLHYLMVTFVCTAVSGAMVWLFGRPAMHVGASGLIYGYFGFLLLAGWLGHELKLLLISIVVAVLYAGMFYGVLPTQSYISWESHLFGLLAGLGCALMFRKKPHKSTR